MSEKIKAGICLYEKIGQNGQGTQFKFEVSKAFGKAQANRLRQIMLSELGSVKIRAFGIAVEADGETDDETNSKTTHALHRFDALDHIVEDMTCLARNLSHGAVSKPDHLFDETIDIEYAFGSNDFEGESLSLEVSYKDLNKRCSDGKIEFANGDDYVMTIVRENPEQEVGVALTLSFNERCGFVSVSDNLEDGDDAKHLIPIECQHSPVKRCAFHEEKDGSTIIFDIETNGAVEPAQVLKEAIEIFEREGRDETGK